MSTIKNFALSIIFFTFAMLVIILIDYSLRNINGIRYGLGFNETLWFLLHIVISIVALFIYFKNDKNKKITKKLFLMGILSAIGFCIYILTIGYYVISSGIDSL